MCFVRLHVWGDVKFFNICFCRSSHPTYDSFGGDCPAAFLCSGKHWIPFFLYDNSQIISFLSAFLCFHNLFLCSITYSVEDKNYNKQKTFHINILASYGNNSQKARLRPNVYLYFKQDLFQQISHPSLSSSDNEHNVRKKML